MWGISTHRIFKVIKQVKMFMTIVMTHSRQQTHGGEPSDSTARNRLTDGPLLQPLFASGQSQCLIYSLDGPRENIDRMGWPMTVSQSPKVFVWKTYMGDPA